MMGIVWLQAERLELLSMLQQLPLKVRTEEQEAILQGLSQAEMGAFMIIVLHSSSPIREDRSKCKQHI